MTYPSSPPPPWGPPPPPQPRRQIWPWFVFGGLGLLVAVIVAASSLGSALGRTGTSAAERTAVAAPHRPQAPVRQVPAPAAPPSQAAAKGLGDGAWIVGTDIQPGTYRSAGPTRTYMACWVDSYTDLGQKRKRDTVQSWGQVILEVTAEDKLVDVHGCEPFVKMS